MSKLRAWPLAPDQAERDRALETARSVLVQAPAGSGKTDLLTRRFLTLLGEVDDPRQIVAITFTRAAAAEMRHRILSELEKASSAPNASEATDKFSMESLARRALLRSRALGWQLPDLSAQLRIATIDSFCRELAIQQPLLSGLGNDLAVHENPQELYRRAARQTLTHLEGADPALAAAVQDLLLWRDNGWNELESLLVGMLGQRDRWMQGFLLTSERDWDALRARLEQPFVRAVQAAFAELDHFFDHLPGARDEAMQLVHFASEQSGGTLHCGLAELAEMPTGPFATADALEEARQAMLCLADFLLTDKGEFRSRVSPRDKFPPNSQIEKARFATLTKSLSKVDGLASALAAFRRLPSARYTHDEWRIIRACFTLLRQAAGELHTVFADAGTVDFVEIAQKAQQALRGADGLPSDAALAVADGIHHLLVDEFQDTSRRQHRLLASLVAAWPDPAGRSLFVVGDPMQSIYFFRDADAELFPRVRHCGLELFDQETLPLDFVPLAANFRTEPALLRGLNDALHRVFAQDDGSGVTFSPSEPARAAAVLPSPRLSLHCDFMPQSHRGVCADSEAVQRKQAIDDERKKAHTAQIDAILALIRSQLDRVEQARERGVPCRIAVLGRTRTALEPIAAALRERAIPFRAVDLEKLQDRPEILDALALGRALLNPTDRIAWLGVLRAPWCGLSLAELHLLTSADNEDVLKRSIPELMRERIYLLSPASKRAIERLQHAANSAQRLANQRPTTSFGTWLQQAWRNLGGASCVDAQSLANLHLLWDCLDALSNGAQDFLGPALSAALEKLTAMPDPEATSEYGIQLMTIHKSKGLEFEVVVLPELQARSGRPDLKLLSWLERGLAQPSDSDEVTEFLVAPLQTKGGDRSPAKLWVDRLYREREKQEMRRIFYVAATRAREEFHIFGRPEYRDEAGELRLVNPGDTLLATAWPAFETEIRRQFNRWREQRNVAPSDSEELVDLAASASELLPFPGKSTIVRRLPHDFELPANSAALHATTDSVQLSEGQLYERHEGGAASRALGSAVHKLLEELARRRVMQGWSQAATALASMLPRIKAAIRMAGISQSQANTLASQALEIALRAVGDLLGQWILSPHTEASSEAAWTGVVAGALRAVRVDRIFRAGLEPLSEGNDALWIIDYKTAHADKLEPLFALPALRSLYAPQLESYAAVLRNAGDRNLPLRVGLYYPRMSLFDWWPIDR